MSIELRPNLRGYEHPHSRLQPGEAEMIRERHTAGVSQRQLAREYHLSQMTVFRIVWFQSYDAD